MKLGGNSDVQRIGKLVATCWSIRWLTSCFLTMDNKLLSLETSLIALVGHCRICIESLKMSGYGVLTLTMQEKRYVLDPCDIDVLGSAMPSSAES